VLSGLVAPVCEGCGMNGKINIRPIEEGDFEAARALYQKSVRANPCGFIQDLDYHGCLTSRMAEWRMKGGDVLTSHIDSDLVALGALAPQPEHQVELCKLHVDPAWQRRGLGRLMAEQLIALARIRAFSEVILHVTVTQTAAIRLYSSLGFEPVRKEIYRTRVFDEAVSFDTLHMRLPLVPEAAGRSGDATSPRTGEVALRPGQAAPHVGAGYRRSARSNPR